MFEEQMKQIAKNVTKNAADIIQNITPIDVIQGTYFIVSTVIGDNDETI